MNHIQVVVIGGGATGTGILRDLSMRGIPALLVEKADLASGTSSRFHGLLHSGARYAVNDHDAAVECIKENTILRRIGKFCVEETEGYFVRTPGDDPEFEAKWVSSCRACGIDVEPISVAEALRREPNLTPDAEAVYRVPDSAVDGFRLVWHNVMSARRYGGTARTYCTVTSINSTGGTVTGVTLRDTRTGETETVACDLVINATGSWAGEVASLAGLSVSVTPDRGTLLAFNHRFTNRVVNRLRKPTDGDIFVPHGSIVIFGTTSVPTERPDDTRPRSEDVLYLLEEGAPLFPKIRDYRILRAFAGTRPLYSPSAATGRAATRNFVIIDHEEEGLSGMLTVTGGKFTSFRLMAEKTVDAAAKKLGVTTPCRTAEESIVPAPDEALMKRATNLFPSEGSRLAVSRLGDYLEQAVATSEKDPWKKLLLCECEIVTLAEFETVAAEPTSHSLGDIRRRTRLGMGTCQGSFCALRATGALVENALMPDAAPRDLFRQFLQERWGGIRPLLWGTQLKEIELERGIYVATLNIDGSIDGAGNGANAEEHPAAVEPRPFTPEQRPVAGLSGQAAPSGDEAAYSNAEEPDVVVVGAGFSGLVAAATAASRGKSVLVINRGGGALTIGGGTVDVLGFADKKAVSGTPFDAMHALPPEHPYRVIGPDAVKNALEFLAEVLDGQGVTMLRAGSEQAGNAWLPTAAGTMKPTWITGASMNPASLARANSFVVLGITGMKDFSSQLAASGLAEWPQFAGKRIDHEQILLPSGGADAPVRDTTALDLACFLDTPAGEEWFTNALASLKSKAEVVLLPSILGTLPESSLHARLEKACGRKIIELFCPPPSVTGLRMHRALMRALRAKGVRFVENATVTGAITEGDRCRALVTALTGKERHYHAKSFIIATGGLFSEGIQTRPGQAMEAIFKLPVAVPAVQDDWSAKDFFNEGHPFATLGVSVNGRLNPVDEHKNALWENVHFVGRSLGGYDFASEKSGSGVALATGHFAGTLV